MKILGIAVILLQLMGCKVDLPSPTPGPSQSPTPSPLASPTKIVWENYKWYPEYDKVLTEGLETASNADKYMPVVCPKWAGLDKKAVWIKLWKAVITCESSFNLYSTYQEDMGNDSITGRPVMSEGLLQLSYQDYDSYKTKECAGFDWAKDKNKDKKDPTKTIFDPIINLSCGMSIVKKHFEWGSPKWKFPPQAYWACLRDSTSGPSEFKKLAKECF